MHLMQHDKHSRRAFLRRSGHLALMGAAAPLGLNLAAMGEAAAFNANDYKALVCVFLFGGNDHANTVVAYDNASHAAYARIRAAGADCCGSVDCTASTGATDCGRVAEATPAATCNDNGGSSAIRAVCCSASHQATFGPANTTAPA